MMAIATSVLWYMMKIDVEKVTVSLGMENFLHQRKTLIFER